MTATSGKLLLLLLLAGGPAQAPAQDQPKQNGTAWPELAKKDEPKVTLLLRRVETGSEEEAATSIRELCGFGPAIVPTLLRKLALPRQSRTLVDGMLSVLDTVVKPEHADLVAKALDDRSQSTRRWAVLWLALHLDEKWRPLFERFATPPESQKPKDPPDPEMVFLSNLGLAALKDTDALARVMTVCHTEWLERGGIVGRVLPVARSQQMARFVIDTMHPDDERSRVTGLRMMRYLAPKEFAAAVAVYLDAGEFSVKKEAINALRVIVDGAQPLEELSSFTGIEMAKKWKERIK